MARIRTIKPEFPHSESMGSVSREARLLFVLLWTIADDAGRTRAASRLLASLLYPFDDDARDVIDLWLDELEAAECIVRYSAGGTRYLAITHWAEHQKIDRPSESKLPEPPGTREDSPDPREDSRALAPRARALDLGPRTMDKDLGPRNGTKPELPTEGPGVVTTEDWAPLEALAAKAFSGATTRKANGRWLAWFANLVNKAKFHQLTVADAGEYWMAFRISRSWQFVHSKERAADEWGKYLADTIAKEGAGKWANFAN